MMIFYNIENIFAIKYLLNLNISLFSTKITNAI